MIIPVIVIIGIFVMSFSSDKSEQVSIPVFHATLADPNLYKNGVYTEKFTIEKGQYSFRFVPNGSSPKILSVSMTGSHFDFSEDFKLESILQKTAISEYFTWKYNGEKNIVVSEMQEILIIINPNGNTMGSVTVDILEN